MRYWVTIGLWLALLAGCQTVVAQVPLRLAIFDAQGDETGEVGVFLRTLAKEETARFELLDEALVRGRHAQAVLRFTADGETRRHWFHGFEAEIIVSVGGR